MYIRQQTFSMPWGVLSLNVDSGDSVRTALLSLRLIVHATIFYMAGFSLTEWFEPQENGQKYIGTLDPGLRDPGRILGTFLEILAQ